MAGGPHGELYVSFAHYRGTPLFYAYAGPAFSLGKYADNRVEVARSDDVGASWSAFHEVAPEALTCGYGGPPVVSPDGTVSIPLTRYPDSCLYDPTGTYAPPTASANFLVARSRDGGSTFTTEHVFTATSPADIPYLFPALTGDPEGGLVAGWARGDGRVAVSFRGAGGQWSPPVLWTPTGGNVSVAPGLVARAGGGATIAYMTQGNQSQVFRPAELHLAWGNATGPIGNTTLSGRVEDYGGANGDFANLVALPDGRLASALAVYDRPQRTFHVMVFVASPTA